MSDPVDQIADTIHDTPANAVLRIGKVIELQAGPGSRARLDIAGLAWLGLDTDARIGVGDRVYALEQGSVWVVAGKLTGTPVPAVPVGALTLWAGEPTALPNGWLLCDGRAVDRTDFAALFAAIGTVYGAPSSSTFAMPNLSNRVPVGAVTTTRSRGSTGGSETVTLTDAQMPSHSHTFTGGSHNHSQDPHDHATVTAAYVGSANVAEQQVADNVSGRTGSTTATNNAATAGGTNSTAGADTAHSNMQPWLALWYIIRAL